MDSNLIGKWALVTGASRGIGAAIAHRLAAEGVNLALHYRSHRTGIEEVEKTCSKAGVETMVFQADLSEPSEAAKLADSILDRDLSIQILVNNAGLSQAAPLWSFKGEDWNRIQNVNLESPRVLIQNLLPTMLRGRWGRIINLSSVLSTWGGRGNSAYCVSKAGINGLTRAVALEVGRKGITANAIAPGLVETDMAAEMGDEMMKQIISRTPLNRAAKGEEIAEAVVFLCRCGYVTGEVLYIDGGLRQSF
ncbi:MAG: 3-oxoacyl-ACP reductase FabG [Candidatus Omnitrophica bacterium]|nr:3-oxoacyl-ACP reductase FabG [Candidatus Omnitrophota bacterium]